MPRHVIGEVSWQALLGDFVSTISISGTGLIVAASLAGDAIVVDVDGTIVCKLTDHPMGVLSAAWSPNGSRFAVGGQDGLVRVYESGGRELNAIRCNGWIAAAQWSPDGALLAVAAGRSLVVCDADGALVHRYPDVSSTITSVAWATNGRRVGVTSYGGITWYDPDHLPHDAPSRTHRFKGSPLELQLSPNGKWACAGFQDSSIHLWRLWSGDDLSMSGYPAKIELLSFRHDSQWMASICLDELTVWDFSGRGPKGSRPASGIAHERHISTLAWEPAGDRLATGGADGRLVLWPSPKSVNRALVPLETLDHEIAIATLAWLPGGDALMVGRADGTLEHRTIER